MKKRPELLLIDHDPETLALTKNIASYLMPADLIATFSDPGDALRYIILTGACGSPGDRPGLILTDLRMPGINGFDFLDMLFIVPMEYRGRFAIYVLTADPERPEIQRLNGKPGFGGSVMEPLKVEKLEQLLKAAGLR